IITINNINYKTITDSDGKFSITINQELSDGTHLVFIQSSDENGLIANSSESVTIDTTTPLLSEAVIDNSNSELIDILSDSNIVFKGISEIGARVVVDIYDGEE
ncbi:Ig-like domain-containing protein, partial [Vibrio splendidus]